MENIIPVIILILFLAIIAHIVYEIFLKKKFKSYTIDDFYQQRLLDGKPEKATDTENEDAFRVVEEAFDCWSVIEDDGDNSYRSPLKVKEIKESSGLLNVAITIAPTDEQVVGRLNELSQIINNANKRKFNGSKTLIIVSLLSFLFISFVSETWSSAFFFIGSIVFYILSSFTPSFIIDRNIFKGKGRKASFMSSIIGGLFGSIATAKTVKYIDPDTRQVVDVDNSQTWITMIFTFIILLLISFFICFIAIINYIRNYWLYI